MGNSTYTFRHAYDIAKNVGNQTRDPSVAVLAASVCVLCRACARFAHLVLMGNHKAWDALGDWSGVREDEGGK